MISETMPIGQIITVLVFLAGLLVALFFVRRHGSGWRQHFATARRAEVVNELSLGPQERLRIVQIDNREYVIISGRNGTPAFFALPVHSTQSSTVASEDGSEPPKSLHAFSSSQNATDKRGAGK